MSRLNHEVRADIASSFLFDSHAASDRNLSNGRPAATNAINQSSPAIMPSLDLMQDLQSNQIWQPFVFAYAGIRLNLATVK